MSEAMAIDRIIIDFDNTLFDADDFKVALASSLKPFGVNDELFWGTYRHARESAAGECSYQFEKHVDLMRTRQEMDRSGAVSTLQGVLDRAEQFLYHDSKELLSRLISLGIPATLLSRGDPEFQRAKIKASGIDKLVNRVIVTDRPKIELVPECIEEVRGSVYWIDDHLDATVQVYKGYPTIVPILKRRPDLPPERYLGLRMLNFRTLTEIRDYLTIVHATNPHYHD